MKNKRLAQWLQDHLEMLGHIDDEKDNTFHVALYESIIDVALNDETRMLNSVLESAAAHAVAIGRELTDLLDVSQRLRSRIWERIGEEIDPEPAFAMLSDLDTIFVHITRVTIDTYQEGTKLALAARASEISRLYTDSEQKVMEYAAEVVRANRELAQLEQAKTDFISIAAHELKTPLTLIQGYVNILSDLQLGDQAASLAGGINRGAERMGVIINDMLDLSALDMNTLILIIETVNLKRTLGLIVDQLQSSLTERNQTAEVNLNTLPEIEADGRRLHQIFKHILYNAIKYTPDTGHITITGQEVAPTRTKPACVQITIADTGVGIAPEDRERIFEKFYRVGDSDLHSTGQTKFMGAGPGLGLAIAKGLVEAHGGEIHAESPGFDMKNFPGSRFVVTLPVNVRPRPGIQIERITRPKLEEAQETEADHA
ncbi:MAG: HAMP domain-containing histidine kinase [Anaerolineae bacterium]|nr:HAMP domain-containing histidine kinase [Anaerolineae bacterium]